ncbi:hypothetical protein BaRGS_00031094 [Batillaria attramentaria]|uniref:Uncharacterized protein n=1 Tax=Batillaria attramentaria TaxID=370345 RepID=A0ABD0JRM3_9CAEN
MMTSHCGVTLAIICWMIVFFKQTQTSNGSELSFSPCGGVGKICRCRGTTADCSRNGGKLTFIPAFSRRITALNISFNRLSSIRSENFFKNVTELTELDISGNYMSTVKTGAFKVCTRLNILYSRKNKMNYSTLGEILDIPTLRVLDLTHCSLRNMPNDLFHRNVTSRLTTLILDKNMNTRMNMSAVKPLRYLKHLSLSQSLVSGVVPDHLPFLEKLEITFTFLSSFPLTCDDRGEAFYPTLVYMDMNGNRVTSVPSPFFVEPYLCLPNLTVLKLNHNCLITLDMTVFKHLNNLRELSSTRSSIENIYPEYLRSLRRLDVHNNLLQHFPETCVVGSRSFYPRLSYLDIGLNEIRFFSYPNPAPTICLPWLTELVIKYPEQDELDMSFFKHLTNLTKLNAKKWKYRHDPCPTSCRL